MPKTTKPFAFDFDTTDGCSESHRFATIKEARAWAHNMIGPQPDAFHRYAVGAWGDQKITPRAGLTISTLFPD